MIYRCTTLFRKKLAFFLVAAILLTAGSIFPASKVAAATTPIPSGNFTIQSDGVYQLDNGYSGIISIGDAGHQPADVTIIGSADGQACNAGIVIPAAEGILNLTIQDLKLNYTTGNGLDIQTTSTLNLYLSGTNTITASGAGIHVPSGTTLVIDKANPLVAPGTLTVNSGQSFAGIGGVGNENVGTVTINGGTVNANGGDWGAGIGGSTDDINMHPGGNGGTVNINGGTVNATGGYGAAGIGGSWSWVGIGGSGGTVNITGGTVNAIGGYNGAGIGGGFGVPAGSGGTISITGGTVNATGGNYGAGIGGGGCFTIFGLNCFGGDGGTISITNGTVNATGGFRAAGIGSGFGIMPNTNNGVTIGIAGGIVSATGGQGAAGIGGAMCNPGGTVTLGGSPTMIVTGDTAQGAQHIGYGAGGSSSGSLKDGSASNLSYLRFHVINGSSADISGAKVTEGGNNYITNSSGVTGCMVALNTTASYPVLKAAYLPGTASISNSVMNNDISVTMSAPASVIATVTSGTYTVSAGGTGNETISNVPSGTTKVALESNLSKGESHQTWNDSGISSTVASGDTLVVTAQDSVTQVTYTISVNPPLSSIATITSAAYTVSTGGTAHETITNVPSGTTKAAFEANLTKGESHQTWNDSGIQATVASGDTLVVTAQDSVTQVTYTISVNPPLSSIATITSAAYTVSTGGTAHETITNVPSGTSKASFESNLTKGESHQTWNDAGISATVASGDTLVVTAQDSVTQVTYTIAVNPPVISSGGSSAITIINPTITTQPAASITTTSASMKGNIAADGNAAINDYGFLYGSSPGNLNIKMSRGNDNYRGDFSSDLTGLSPGQTYYYRAYILSNQGQIIYGNVLSFTTQAVPLQIQTILRFYIGKTDYYMNDKKQAMDTAPIILAGRTMLPVRYIAMPLGATVNWNNDEQKATIILKNTTIELWIGQNTAKINGVATPIDPNNPNVTPILVPPGRAMLPLSFIAQTLGCQVDWDQTQQMVTVTYPQP